jgi:hypothetical protein
VSRRQHERASSFQGDIEASVRLAAVAFRDNDVEHSITAAARLWWGSRLRGRRFVQLVHQAREITQVRISLGAIKRGQPGRRNAMPYFLAVLRDLVSCETRSLLGEGRSPSPKPLPAPTAPDILTMAARPLQQSSLFPEICPLTPKHTCSPSATSSP